MGVGLIIITLDWWGIIIDVLDDYSVGVFGLRCLDGGWLGCWGYCYVVMLLMLFIYYYLLMIAVVYVVRGACDCGLVMYFMLIVKGDSSIDAPGIKLYTVWGYWISLGRVLCVILL